MLPIYLHGIKYIQIQQTTKQGEGKNKQPAERKESERERAENMHFYSP